MKILHATDAQAPVRSVSLSTAELAKMLDAMDAASSPDCDPDPARRSSRKIYRTEGLTVYVLGQDGKALRHLIVPTRNLSNHGLSFLNKQMLAPGQQLELHIPVPNNDRIVLRGKVARCRYISRMVHEIGVEFTKLISGPSTGASPMRSIADQTGDTTPAPTGESA